MTNLTHLNAKNSQAKLLAAPVINPKNKTKKVEVYHPTKGWRYISPKRMRAAEIMVRTGLRGAAIAGVLKDEWRAR